MLKGQFSFTVEDYFFLVPVILFLELRYFVSNEQKGVIDTTHNPLNDML